MTTRHRLLVVGSLLVATAAYACSEFSSSDDAGSTADGGSSNGDSNPTNDVDATGDASVIDTGIDARCAHTFCADFDDLEAGTPPNTGWTEAARDSVGATVELVQSEAKSAPNAARFVFPNAAHTYFVFRHETEAGAPIKDATLTFAIRPKIGEIPDGGETGYTTAAVVLRDVDGNEVGSVTLDWRQTDVRIFGWVGNGASIGGVWDRPAGTLAIDQWLVVTLETDVANKKAIGRIRDVGGVTLGEATLGGRDWPEIHSVKIEIGAWESDQVRPELSLTFDDVFLDVTR